MNEQMEMDSHLEFVFMQLLHEVNLVTLKWLTAHELFGVSEERVELLNRTAGGFFSVIQVSLRDDTFISLSRLTDPIQSAGKDNLTLLTLSEHLAQFRDRQFLESLQKQITDSIAKCEGIRIWRNKRLAHSDLNVLLKYDPSPLPGISVKQVDDAIRFIQDVINTFSQYFFGTINYFGTIIQTGGPDRLFHHLKIALAAQEREIEKKINLHG